MISLFESFLQWCQLTGDEKTRKNLIKFYFKFKFQLLQQI